MRERFLPPNLSTPPEGGSQRGCPLYSKSSANPPAVKVSFPSTPARSSILQSAEGVPYPLL